MLGFLASRGEESNPGPVTRLDHSELLLIKLYESIQEIEKTSEIVIRSRQKEWPPSQ